MSTHTKPGHARATGDKYEKSDFQTDFVWSFVFSLLGLMFAGMVVTFLMYAGYNKLWTDQDQHHQPSRLAAGLPAHAPEPRLQELPAQDLAEFNARQQAALHSYGWVEPAAGVVRIPIERAMELTLERGLPVRAGQANGERGAGKGTPPPVKRP
jgi:hypothetical protein